MKKLVIPIKKDGYVETYLQVLNGMLGLAPTELAILGKFIEYDPDVACSTAARKFVVESLEFKNVAVLNNYIKKLKDRGLIINQGNGIYTYAPIVQPGNYTKGIQFDFVYHGTVD
jgi:hypothetical protein